MNLRYFGIIFVTSALLLLGSYSLVTLEAKKPQPQSSNDWQTNQLLEKKPVVLQPATSSKEANSIFFTGDIMLGRDVETLSTRFGLDYPFKKLGFLLEQPAYIVGNFESAIAIRHKKTPDFNTVFSTNADVLPTLRNAGFTHLSLANNHAFDYKATGFENTKESLAINGIVSFGQPDTISSTSVSFIKTPNKTIALVAINLVGDEPKLEVMKSAMDYATQSSDFQIAYLHWGNEYNLKSSRAQEGFARKLISVGVDLIIGHHPHVVQSVDVIDGVVVFYSLGNFIFDQYFSRDVQQGLALQLITPLSEEDGYLVMLYPVTSEAKHAQPSLMNKSNAQKFLDSLSDRSNPLLLDDMLTGTINLTKYLQI